MDVELYAQRMRFYYQNRVAEADDWTGPRFAENTERDYHGAKPQMRELADAVCDTLAGRDVLELAAGMGQYARFLARTATSLLATDATERALSRLNDGVNLGQDLPPGRVRTMPLDAWLPDDAIDSLGGERFDGLLAVNWFQHLPLQQVQDWVERVHRLLRPGARVVIATNHLSGPNRWTLFHKPDDPNLWEARRTHDGVPVDIIDNVYGRADIMGVFARHANRIECFCGKAYHWVVYDRP